MSTWSTTTEHKKVLTMYYIADKLLALLTESWDVLLTGRLKTE